MSVFPALFLGIVALFYCFLLRSRSSDRLEIEGFAKQHGLCIISVTRSYVETFFPRYWVRVSNIARFYDVAVEDSEGKQANMKVAFDPFFGSKPFDILKYKERC